MNGEVGSSDKGKKVNPLLKIELEKVKKEREKGRKEGRIKTK